MANVAEIWSARNLQRGLRRHWVKLGDEMLISGGRSNQSGTLSFCRPAAGGPLIATLKLATEQIADAIGRGSQLVIGIEGLRLVVAVRAVDGARLLLEFGMPRGNQARIALGA